MGAEVSELKPRGWEAHRREGESPMTGSEAKRERMAQYLEWLLTPEGEREPRTKSALADLMGITYQTLAGYSRDPMFQRKLTSERARLRKVEHAEDVLRRLYDTAMGDSPQANAAAKLWLQYTLDFDDDSSTDVDMSDLSNDEVMDLAVRVLNHFTKGE